jgi:hypothetical protein
MSQMLPYLKFRKIINGLALNPNHAKVSKRWLSAGIGITSNKEFGL